MTKRPFMVEFMGTPEAGKTSTIHALENQFLITPYTVTHIQESAELLPSELPKGSWYSNLYMRYHSLCNLLVNFYQTNDITLIDRGLYDGNFWCKFFYEEGNCSEKQYYSNLAINETLGFNSDLVIALMTSPEEAIRRRGGEGRLVTLSFIEAFNKRFLDYYHSITNTPKILINTTGVPQGEIVMEVFHTILSYYEKNTS